MWRYVVEIHILSTFGTRRSSAPKSLYRRADPPVLATEIVADPDCTSGGWHVLCARPIVWILTSSPAGNVQATGSRC